MALRVSRKIRKNPMKTEFFWPFLQSLFLFDKAFPKYRYIFDAKRVPLWIKCAKNSQNHPQNQQNFFIVLVQNNFYLEIVSPIANLLLISLFLRKHTRTIFQQQIARYHRWQHNIIPSLHCVNEKKKTRATKGSLLNRYRENHVQGINYINEEAKDSAHDRA